MPHVNLIAVLLCGVASLVLGAIWYSPMLFAKPWQRAAGLSDEQSKSGNMAVIFGTAFVLYLAWVPMFRGRAAAPVRAGADGRGRCRPTPR